MADTNGRRAQRLAAIEAAKAVLSTIDADDTSPTAVALREMVAASTPKAKVSTPRVILDKADPTAVREYFDSLGLPRKTIAQASGVGTSTIATVQNPKGDRWSQERFEEVQGLIAAWIEAHEPEVTAVRQADAAAQAARDAKAQAKAARAAARAAAPVTTTTATTATPAKGKGPKVSTATKSVASAAPRARRTNPATAVQAAQAAQAQP